jgi:hypothetical protein
MLPSDAMSSQLVPLTSDWLRFLLVGFLITWHISFSSRVSQTQLNRMPIWDCFFSLGVATCDCNISHRNPFSLINYPQTYHGMIT